MTTTTAAFPFTLADLDGWVIKYKGGKMVRFLLDRSNARPGAGFSAPGKPTLPFTGSTAQSYGGSVSSYCKHDPTKDPVFSHVFKRKGGKGGQIDLFIADSEGARAHKTEFDIVIDGGQVIHPYDTGSMAVLKGDPIFVQGLKQFEMVSVLKPRVLRIEWLDRQDPDLAVEFWPALAQMLEDEVIRRSEEENINTPLRVLTVCQGGHGRSGTSLTALMMVWSDYSALDAITHLRAVHCARAIESNLQHEYLDKLAKHLGRDADSMKAKEVKDFRKRFLDEVDSKFAKPYQDRLTLKALVPASSAVM